MPDYVGEIVMRSGDQLPMLAVAIEDDMGQRVDITGATAATILLIHTDGEDPREDDGGDPMPALPLPAEIVNPTLGLVMHDWDVSYAPLRPGVLQIVLVVDMPTGSISAPSDRSARLIIRPDGAIDSPVPL